MHSNSALTQNLPSTQTKARVLNFAVVRSQGSWTLPPRVQHQVKLSAADRAEMVADAVTYLKAAGIKNPTNAQVRAQIQAEHGYSVAVLCFQKTS